MELLLNTKCYDIDGHPYFRIHLTKKHSNLLGLQQGDTLLVDIKEIVREKGDKKKRYQVKLLEITA